MTGPMNLRITDGTGRTVEMVTVLPPAQVGPFTVYTDTRNHRVAVFTAAIPDVGPGVTIGTSTEGCMVPASAVDTFVREMHAAGRAAAGTEDTAGQEDVGTAEPGPYSVLTGYTYVDTDQDAVTLSPAVTPEAGPAVLITVSRNGCSIPNTDLTSFTGHVLTMAQAARALTGEEGTSC